MFCSREGYVEQVDIVDECFEFFYSAVFGEDAVWCGSTDVDGQERHVVVGC